MAAADTPLARIIDEHILSFDPADPANGSMYVCEPAGSGLSERIIGALRAEGLWSDAPVKQVPDAHRDAYKAQLQYVDSREYRIGGGLLVLLRGDHPKYPSSAERWAAWNAVVERLAKA